MADQATAALPDVLLTASAPVCDEREAESISREHFGITGTARSLTSERDRNFLIETAHGDRFVLKVANAAEHPLITDLQTQALLHIAQTDPALLVPAVWPTRQGESAKLLTIASGTTHVVRVISYLDGKPLHETRSTPTQRRALGVCLARLGLALREFQHEGGGRYLLWDLKQAPALRALLPLIPERDQRETMERFLSAYDAHVLPNLGTMRTQMIHSDFNPHNILVSPSNPDVVTGIIDFGDIVRTPLVNDIATAGSYLPAPPNEHPLGPFADLVAAYHSVVPLEDVELDHLFDLVAVRQTALLAITNWRASRHPENRNYILRNASRVWAGLRRLAELTREDAQLYLRRACQKE